MRKLGKWILSGFSDHQLANGAVRRTERRVNERVKYVSDHGPRLSCKKLA